jgi:UDP-2-acetamido-3-amino-2,3-dideoxy-glucuronate N-acetyltransferase
MRRITSGRTRNSLPTYRPARERIDRTRPASQSRTKGAFVHTLADCQSSHIGTGTRIWQFCVVLPGAVIGRNCNVNSHCFIENDVVIGNNVTVKCGVYLWDGMRIEDDVFIGPNATFTNDRFPRSKQRPEKFLQTVLRRGASIGAGAVIAPGLTIGELTMIGAGAVVTKDVPARTVIYGTASRVRRRIE